MPSASLAARSLSYCSYALPSWTSSQGPSGGCCTTSDDAGLAWPSPEVFVVEVLDACLVARFFVCPLADLACVVFSEALDPFFAGDGAFAEDLAFPACFFSTSEGAFFGVLLVCLLADSFGGDFTGAFVLGALPGASRAPC